MIINPECDTEKWSVCNSTIIASADNYYTKPQVDSKIAEMSGATPEQVEEMISESLEDYYTKNEIDGFVSDLETVDNVISGAVDNVSSALTQEVNRAEQAEAALANSIATKADSSALTEEIQRAQNTEGALANDIATKANAVDVYTKVETDNLLNEKADADSVYTKNETDSIVSDLEAADSFISGAVDNVSSALTQEVNRAEQAEGALANDIAAKADASSVYNKTEVDTFVDDLENVDFQISGSVETNRLNILNIGSGLTAETQRAQNAENALADEIAAKADASSVYTKNEINTFVGDLGAADSFISGAVDNVSSALTQESQRAQGVESALSDEIATKANAVDVYTKVETVNLLNEKADADSVYTKNEINTFVSDLEAADSAISGAVDNVSSALTEEVQRAISVESDLADGIETKADRDSVYTKSEIDDFLDDKADADSVYNKAEIDTFVDDLENADFQISGSVETNRLNILNISSGLTAETDRAQGVETALAAAISGKADTSAVTEEISAAVSGKADSSAVTEEISAAVSGKADSDSVYTKSETDTLLAEKADSSAVTEAISAAVSGKADTSAVTEEISAAVSGKADTSAVTEEISAAVSGKADSSAVTQEISAAVSGKQDTLVSGTNIKTINNESILGSGNIDIQGGSGISSAECQTMIDNSISGKADSSAVTEEISAAVSGKQDTLIAGTNITIVDNVISSSSGGGGVTPQEVEAMIDEAVSGKADTSAVTQEISSAVSGKVDTSAITSSVTSSSTDAEIPTAKAVYDALGGGGSGISSAECQTMIDNSISGKADSSNVYTKTEVDSALSGKASTATTQTLSNTLGTHTADTTIHVTSQEKNTWNGKQNALSAGSGITISNNTISAKIWSGTRTDYDNLQNKDNDTIYLIYS